MDPSRRLFLRDASLYSLGFLGLRQLSAVASTGTPGSPAIAGYGPLRADPQGIFDLPHGFRYRIIARQGERMADGLLRPGDPDGMAAFALADGKIGLICNHELSHQETEKGAFGVANENFPPRIQGLCYDAGHGSSPQLGGTTTLVYDPVRERTDLQYLSLGGTDRNCAGGPTPWNSWISCEETNLRPADDGSVTRDHGYNFEVPVSTEVSPAEPVPLKAMGRFRHEAVAVDPKTGIVYQTEDMGDGLIYRFIPNVPGQLAKGGQLQALALLDKPSFDTRNWPELDTPKMPVEKPLPVRWVDIDDVESPDDNLRFQGFNKGAARFARGEGMWAGDGEFYFACTNGGARRDGQIFRYVPSPEEGQAGESGSPGRLELFVESTSPDLLRNCDNLTVAPNGHLFVCEDTDERCRLVGVDPQGRLYTIGSNPYTDSELAGACFSPDGKLLFLNIQKNGITLAISGPWDEVRT
jgi:secreted PhoX family phosphatase